MRVRCESHPFSLPALDVIWTLAPQRRKEEIHKLRQRDVPLGLLIDGSGFLGIS